MSHTFKEVILTLENFNPSFINLSGYKKLNGSQILKENITYILNTLKSLVEKIETKKTVLHIFNSKFYLDKREIDNLPIGLFGDFYSHELSLSLINTNDYKNIINILNKSNLKVKKILLKSYIKGANIIDNNKDIKTFFHISFDKKKTKVFFFENGSLRFEQNFEFGTDIIIKDISKITFLDTETVERILSKIIFDKEELGDELIESDIFINDNYKKIKKSLIYNIALERIKEIFNIIFFKNVNFQHYRNITEIMFLEINCKLQSKSLKEIYKTIFSSNQKINVKFLENLHHDCLLRTTNKLFHFGWN